MNLIHTKYLIKCMRKKNKNKLQLNQHPNLLKRKRKRKVLKEVG